MPKKLPNIGVLTFHSGPNYGGFMQAWHVRNAVQNAGYPCTVINYLHPAHVESNKVKVPIRSLADVKARIHWAIKRHPFRHLGDTLCEDNFTTDSGKVPWKKYDALVVGSDVIWDFENPAFGHDPCYFGAAPGQENLSLISYAASCGPADVTRGIPAYCDGLKRFTRTSVRDLASVDFVQRITATSPELVVDPTWLYDDPVIQWTRAPKGKYVLVYGPGLTAETSKILANWCKQRGLLLINAASNCPAANKTYRFLTPFQWVDLFRNAEATVVGTLHGTMYSIKYRKPFILLNNKKTRQKVKEAVDRTGMDFRRFEPADFSVDQFDLLLTQDSPLPGIPTEWREQSIGFLESALREISA